MMRIRSKEAAAILGLSRRGLQNQAQRGAVPGSAKIGGLWTFDRDKLDKFVADKEAECLNQTSTYAAASIGCEPPSRASNIAKAYERAMSKLRGSSATSVSTKSSRRVDMASEHDHGSRL
jgi:hypothetical protein